MTVQIAMIITREDLQISRRETRREGSWEAVVD
jgi:hypothetical protein